MKNYYKYILVVVTCMLISNYIHSQQIYKNQINIPAKLYQEGDSIIFMYDIDIRNLNLSSERAMLLTPVLEAPGQELLFPPLLINGKKRYKAYERGKALSDEVGLISDYPVLVAGKDNRSTLHYHESVPYQSWMDNASMYMIEELCGCGSHEEENLRELLVQRIDLVPTPVPVVVPPVPDVVDMKEEFSIMLEYPVSRSELLEDFSNNREKFNELNTNLRRILNNDRARITRMDIKGYASPEGPETFNLNLSENRANALKNYLRDKFSFNNDDYNIYFYGEDWDTLARLVQESDMAEKDEILSIITEVSNVSVRKENLKRLNGGTPYKKMLRELYPQIRRVELHVYYRIE